MNAVNNGGETSCDIARASLELQKESASIEHLMIHPQEPPLVMIYSNTDRLQKNLDARKKEIVTLEQTFKFYE